MHAHYSRGQVNLLNNLVQFKVSHEDAVALSYIAEVGGKIVIQEASLHFVFKISFILNKCSLGSVVVVIKSVNSLSFSKTVVYILLYVEAVHENKSRRLRLFKQLLLEAVAVLSIVNKHFPVCG